MKFLADECCDLSMVNRLREEGYEVDYIQEKKRGTSDTDVLLNAWQDKRVLITEDKDFGELVYRLKNRLLELFYLDFIHWSKRKRCCE